MLTNNLEQRGGITAGGYFGPAEVCEIREGVIYLSIPGAAERLEVAGMLAISHPPKIDVGTRVLAAAQHMDDVYIIGVLNAAEVVSKRIDGDEPLDVTLHKHQQLRVFSSKSELLFEHDPSSCKTRVHVPSGDLELVASDGKIRLESSAGIELNSKSPVQVKSESAIQLGVTDSVGSKQSEYIIGAHGHRVETPQFRLKTASLQAQATETRFTSQTLRSHLGSARVVAQTLETVAETLIQRAKNSFARVSSFWQVKAGKVQCQSESSMHLKSKNATIKADDDVKINGDQIHLG